MELTPDDIRRFWSHVDKSGDCWLWQASTLEYGYGQFGLNGKTYLTHRISYFLEFGDLFDSMVLHKCDNPPCVNPDHLFLGTALDNAEDCRFKCSLSYGDKNGGTKVSDVDIPKIRLLALLGLPQRDIARKFGISQSQVSYIVNFRSRVYS